MADGAVAGLQARIFTLVGQLMAKRDLQVRLEADQPLFDAGLTSLDLVNLMLAVEAEFDLEIPQQEITPENFRSVAAIGRLIESLVVTA